MRDVTMTPCWKTLYSVLLVGLAAGSGACWEQISWAAHVTAGLSTTFSCSSSCSDCTYSWSLGGQTFNGATLIWTPDGRDHMVELHCDVFNPETGVSKTVTSVIEIKNQVSVHISPAGTVPSLNQPLDLLCSDASSGPRSGPVTWYKDGQKVTLREDTQLLHNTTLHFDSLLLSDAGFYQCETMTVFSLGYLLSFDPWNVTISGPGTVFPGRLSEFTCLTSCTLNEECTVRWPFRTGFPVGHHFSVRGNVLKWTPSIPGTFQNFTCVAENAAAGRSAEATKMVEVKGLVLSGSEAVQLNRLFVVIFSLVLLVLFDL